MPSLEKVAEDLIAEFARIQVPGSIPERDDDDRIVIPGQIYGNGRSFLTSRKMEQLIANIARELKKEDASLARSHTDKEWNWIVRGTFGPVLSIINLNDDHSDNARDVLVSVRAQLSKSPSVHECEHVFGCSLFGSADVAAFQIGPVRFEPRGVWLERKVSDKDISSITARRVQRSWLGKSLRERKPSIQTMIERNVLYAIGKCPYVSSVYTQGLASEAARLKSRVAARMGMTAIALCCRSPSTALAGFNLLTDRGVRRQRSLAFEPGKKVIGGGKLVGLPHGPTISSADWHATLGGLREDFDLIGEAISYFLSVDGAATRPRSMNTLAQALLWFHEACRDEVDLMSVVKFSASLDALASGGKTSGILRLINARLGIQNEQPIRKKGPTLKIAIEEIYSQGRSRTIHGTNQKLGHDWSSTRRLAEEFARLCLTAAIHWMVKNPELDDPTALQK